MVRTSHLFRDEAGELSEVSVRVADTPAEWEACREAGDPGWSVSHGTPTVAVRLTRTVLTRATRVSREPTGLDRLLDHDPVSGD